jgi:hypothetical protein
MDVKNGPGHSMCIKSTHCMHTQRTHSTRWLELTFRQSKLLEAHKKENKSSSEYNHSIYLYTLRVIAPPVTVSTGSFEWPATASSFVPHRICTKT